MELARTRSSGGSRIVEGDMADLRQWGGGDPIADGSQLVYVIVAEIHV
ncbi:MAG: hypothetical protein WAN44_03855 [Propionibacteriaceae bacterium]